jgi:hypothetical protein
MGVQDLDKLVVICKNWLSNVRHVALLLEGWKSSSLLKEELFDDYEGRA